MCQALLYECNGGMMISRPGTARAQKQGFKQGTNKAPGAYAADLDVCDCETLEDLLRSEV